MMLTRIVGKKFYSEARALCCLGEEEGMLKEMVSRFATNQIAPMVSEMDQAEQVHPSVLKGLFQNGVPKPFLKYFS